MGFMSNTRRVDVVNPLGIEKRSTEAWTLHCDMRNLHKTVHADPALHDEVQGACTGAIMGGQRSGREESICSLRVCTTCGPGI